MPFGKSLYKVNRQILYLKRLVLKMNKEELIKELSNYLFDKQQAKIAVDRTLEIIKENLQKGEKVVLSNFGSFKVRQSAPLVIKNPKGQIIEVPSKKRVKFKPSENILK